MLEVAPDLFDDIVARAEKQSMSHSEYLRMVSDRAKRADRESYLAAIVWSSNLTYGR